MAQVVDSSRNSRNLTYPLVSSHAHTAAGRPASCQGPRGRQLGHHIIGRNAPGEHYGFQTSSVSVATPQTASSLSNNAGGVRQKGSADVR